MNLRIIQTASVGEMLSGAIRDSFKIMQIEEVKEGCHYGATTSVT
jgi:hypothetical protein